MKNMFKMIKEAGALQKNMKKIQSQLRQKTVEFSVGAGEVKVIARGDGSISELKINPSIVNPDRVSDLEKKILKAIDGALDAAKKMGSSEMKAFASEMGLPNIPGL